MTDAEFAELCVAHQDRCFELTADGELIVQPMPFKSDGRGRACAANQWFVLPNGARRVPDAAWILKSRLATVAPQTPDKFWRIAPDFVVEIRSLSDKLPVLRARMEDWIESGVALAWLIDPERRAVEVYKKGRWPSCDHGSVGAPTYLQHYRRHIVFRFGALVDYN